MGRNKCIDTGEGINSHFCQGCDKKLNFNCPFRAFEPSYKEYDSAFLTELLLKDKKYFDNSRSGITFSGGEPLMQSFTLKPILKNLKRKGIKLVIETSLYSPFDHLQFIAEHVDQFIIDIKLISRPFIASKYRDPNLPFETNLSYIKELGNPFIFRMVMIPQITMVPENIELFKNLIERYSPEHIELLEYHTLGRNKYEALSLTMKEFAKSSDEDISRILQQLKNTSYLKI